VSVSREAKVLLSWVVKFQGGNASIIATPLALTSLVSDGSHLQALPPSCHTGGILAPAVAVDLTTAAGRKILAASLAFFHINL
jgi:hypothetical protein